MSKADDLLTQLNGGEKFAKLDLSRSMYQQVLLDEESSQYVMINTHFGSLPAFPLEQHPVLQFFKR